jgi:hypothetical protein
MNIQKQFERTKIMPKILKIIKYKNKLHFKDDTLSQIREIDNPHKYHYYNDIDWDEVEIQVKNPVGDILKEAFDVE